MHQKSGNTEAPFSIFISYAHEDEVLRQQLDAHLSVMRRQGLMTSWHDRQITPGAAWAEEIDAHLEAASLILLLISPNFLASDYCYGFEMQHALDRHKNGDAQVIPIIVRPVDWEGAPFSHLQSLPRDNRAITEWPNQDAAFREIARGIRAAIEQLRPASPQPQQSLHTLSTPAVPSDRNRQRMLKRVRATWITGVLEQSLHGAALMVLGLEEKADVLDNPWRLLMQEMDRPAQPLPEGTRISQVYNAAEGGLLILGEPGAGKTTLLLELTSDLLERAQASTHAPIPVVFNLSSWVKKRPALSDWLIEELTIRYEVPRQLGKSWVNEDRLLLLLDGLDEVAASARRECIEAINTYRQKHPDVQVIVCSRITEYLNEPTQLRLQTAVVVQPLTQQQIATYLKSIGEQAEILLEALRQDADLRELATTPLMLTILLFVYRDTPPDKISELTSIDAKRDHIFAAYVQHMLKRRGVSKRYKPEQITHWLTYLAQQMKRQSQTVFYIEQMQPDWIPNPWLRYLYRALAGGVVGGLLGGLIGAVGAPIVSLASSPSSLPLSLPVVIAGLNIGGIAGLVLGLILGLFVRKSTEISTAEVITWSWTNACSTAITSIIGGSLGILIIFHVVYHTYFIQYIVFYLHIDIILCIILVYLLIQILIVSISFTVISLFAHRNSYKLSFIIFKQKIWSTARRGVLVGILMGCISLALWISTYSMVDLLIGVEWAFNNNTYPITIGFVAGFITGLIYGASSRQLETHNSFKPNQGIWRSLYNGGRVLLGVGLIVSLIYDIPAIVFVLVRVSAAGHVPPGEILAYLSNQFFNGVIIGIPIGLVFGLLNGGIACIKHILLRIFLCWACVMPWNCVSFFDYAAERILLRKVGGGYIFVHRLLLEYFAAL